MWTIAHIVAPEFGVEPWVMYLAFSVPIAIYMWLGGFHSVINSNIVQFFMAIIFVTVVTVAIAIVAFRDLPSGVSMIDYLQRVVPPGSGEGYNGLSLFSLGVPFIFISIIALLPGWVIEEDWWLKAQSAKTTRAARQGIWANLVYNVIFVLLFSSLIGLFALVVFPPETAFESVLGGDGYAILTVFMSQEFPIWALIILFPMLAGLSMSTMATFTNVCAMNISYDVLQPLVYRKRGWSDARIMSWSRAWSLIVVVIMIGVAFLIDQLPQGLWDAYYLSSGVLSAGVAVPVLAMFWKRANLPGAFAGSLVGRSDRRHRLLRREVHVRVRLLAASARRHVPGLRRLGRHRRRRHARRGEPGHPALAAGQARRYRGPAGRRSRGVLRRSPRDGLMPTQTTQN